MADISKCEGLFKEINTDAFKLCSTCKRYLASTGEYQSWIAPPYKDGKCEMYWEVKE